MKLKLCSFVAYGLIGAMSIGLITACSTANTAGESEFNTAMNACDRMDKTFERETCVNAAIAKYQAAQAKARASTCPKASC